MVVFVAISDLKQFPRYVQHSEFLFVIHQSLRLGERGEHFFLLFLFIERPSREPFFFVCSLSSRPRGNDDDLRLLLHRHRRLLLHDEYLFRAEAAALAQKREEHDDADDAEEATDDDTGDGARILHTAVFFRACDAEPSGGDVYIVVVSDISGQLIGVVFRVGVAHVVCQFEAKGFRVAPVALVPFRERLASTVVIII